jgi:hypothetical protein
MVQFSNETIGDKLNSTDIMYIDGVEYLHPEYTKYYDRWQKIRDLLEGESELKKDDKRETYLPRLNGHTRTMEGNADYDSFVQYASLYNATGRSIDAYRGLLNRKLPHIVLPKEVDDIISNFTIKGESIHTFIEQVEVEVIATNRVGVFVDHPYTDPAYKISRAEARRLNMLPYATLYPAETIINWEEKRINNRIVTTLVVLREVQLVRLSSLVPEQVITYRILELDDNGYYRQIIVQPEKIQDSGLGRITRTYNIVKEVMYPKQNGKYMQYIPFYPVTAQGITWELNKSVIEDLVNVNISHFRNTAIHEKALIWTASPTAVFSGLPDDTTSVAIGSSQGIIIAPGGTAKYLEYEGMGLGSLENALTKKEQQMAILGAKILATEVNGVESGEAAMIHRAGEQGILADIATTVGGAIEKLIRIICEWRGVSCTDKQVMVDINKDYTPAVIDANTIIAIGKEVEIGRLSYESYIGAMQRGEIIPPTRSAEEERRLINKVYTPTTMKEQVKYIDKKYKKQLDKEREEQSVMTQVPTEEEDNNAEEDMQTDKEER